MFGVEQDTLGSQKRERSRRSDQQQAQPTVAPRSINDPNPRRGGRLTAAGGIGARVRDTRRHKGGSAHLVDDPGRVDVVEVERLALVRRRVRVDCHGFGEAGVAGR